MTVKSERGRRRYVVFAVPEHMDRDDLVHAVNRHWKDNAPRVIQCNGGLGVIRCAPGEVEGLCEGMRQAVRGCGSVRSSGTLKTLRDIYPVLREGKAPKPRKNRPGSSRL